MTIRILQGDCREMLRILPDASVHCCVTSPPYFGLRDYGTATWDGGDPACDHSQLRSVGASTLRDDGREKIGTQPHEKTAAIVVPYRDNCGKCGAVRIDSQIGLESSPEEYVTEMVAVFREVWRVLRDDASLWLNLGDSYAGGGGFAPNAPTSTVSKSGKYGALGALKTGGIKPHGNIKPKDLMMIPARVALALQADGWYLRSDIIWAKKNCMPESVTDRPSQAHEHVFLLTKRPKYFYDAEAIREEGVIPAGTRAAKGSNVRSDLKDVNGRPPEYWDYTGTRNSRNVWSIATQPFPDAHFATFPPELAERCISAGASEKGCCAACGAPWAREVETNGEWRSQHDRTQKHNGEVYRANPGGGIAGVNTSRVRIDRGWSPTCQCAASVIPCTVLDPFAGAFTSLMVADRLQRHGIGIELNAEYCAMAERRIHKDAGLFADIATAPRSASATAAPAEE